MAHPNKYRTFWRRFFAGLIDAFVTLPIGLLGYRLIGWGNSNGVIFAGALLSGLGYLAYSVLMHAKFGQTLGKMATGVKVLDLTETRIPTLKQAFLRDFGYVVLETASLFVLADRLAEGLPARPSGANEYLDWAENAWFLLEVVTMLTNSKRRAFHDFIAWTVVVRTK